MDRLVQRDDEQEIMLSTEVMRHMLLETTDLLEESQTYLDEAERSTAAAAALSTASRHLLDLSTWISKQMTGRCHVSPMAPLGTSAAAELVDAGALNDKMLSYVIRVARLYDRAAHLDALTRQPNIQVNPVDDGRKVIPFPGAAHAVQVAPQNPVSSLHKRLDLAFRLG